MKPLLVRRIKIIVILVIAYGISTVSSHTVFVTGTPQFNTSVFLQIRDIPMEIWSSSRDYISQVLNRRKEYAADQSRVARNVTVIPGASNGAFVPAPTSSAINTQSDPNPLIRSGYTQTKDGIFVKYDATTKYVDIQILSDKSFVTREMVLGGKRVTIMVRGD